FLQHKESATGNPSFLAADSIYWVTRTLRYPVAQPAQIERCNKRMANSLSNGHKSPRRQGSASCSSYCSLGTRWKESRTGCPAFLSKFIVIGGDKDEHISEGTHGNGICPSFFESAETAGRSPAWQRRS